MYSSLSDIKGWLRDDTVDVNDANTKQPGIDADRLIRARLSGVFAPAVFSSWADPETTPELIRSVSGQLTAAYLLRKLASIEGDKDISAYAQQLWNEANAKINDIIIGNDTVVDANNAPIDTTGENLISFFPNNQTQPMFSINDVFA